MHQIRFRLGLRPRPRWGRLQRSTRPLAGFQGPTSKGSEGRRRGRGREGGGEEKGKEEGREGKGEGREGKGEGGEEKGLPPYAIGTPHFLDQRYAPVYSCWFLCLMHDC